MPRKHIKEPESNRNQIHPWNIESFITVPVLCASILTVIFDNYGFSIAVAGFILNVQEVYKGSGSDRH